jgi:putative hydrolase of the HAD superfamily
MAIIHTAALIFDLDDTLFPERDFVFSGFQAVGDWLETNLSLSGFAEVARAIYL